MQCKKELISQYKKLKYISLERYIKPDKADIILRNGRIVPLKKDEIFPLFDIIRKCMEDTGFIIISDPYIITRPISIHNAQRIVQMAPSGCKVEICTYSDKERNKHYKKPDNHGFIIDLQNMAAEISTRPVLIDQERLLKHSHNDMKAKALRNFLNSENKPILYDVWGSKTGRLATKTGSFPIMNLKKELANCVIPKNDIFVQFDLNGAEIRTLISLAGKEQPEEDIHEWNMKNIYHNITERSKAKQRFFAWLYNPNSKDQETEKHYTREQILNKHYNNSSQNRLLES